MESVQVARTLTWIILSPLIAWIGFKMIKIVKRIVLVCNELVLYRNLISISGENGKHLQIHTYLCQSKDLDEVTMNELYRFYVTDFSTTGTLKDLTKMVNSFSHVLLCRSRVDGSLRGAGLYKVKHHQGYTTLNQGLFLFKNHFKGSGLIYFIAGIFIFRELVRHPLTPVYIIGKVHAYKSYLVSMRLLESYPRYNLKTPPKYKKIFDDYAEEYIKLRPDAKYDPDRFVVEVEMAQVKEYMSALSEYDLQNPHIKYFVETNPGWTKGHSLITAIRMTWIDLAYALMVGFRKASRREKEIHSQTSSYAGESEATSDGPRRRASSKKPSISGRPRLLKRFTFQDITANSYATDYFEMDMGGHCLFTGAKIALESDRNDTPVFSPDSRQLEFDVDLSSLKF